MSSASQVRVHYTGYRPKTAMQFATESVKYGFSSFYKVGVSWWVLTILYFLIDLFVTVSPAVEPGFNPTVLLSLLFIGFLLMLIKFPYLVIGLSYQRKGEGDLKDVSLSWPTLRPYAGACLILTFVMIPVYFPSSLKLDGTPSYVYLFTMLAMVAVFLVLIRIFPLQYAVLDKKIDTLTALKHSLKLTSTEFRPILTLMVILAVIEAVFSLIPYEAGSLISTPVNYLASVHAYKLLDHNYEMLRADS